MPERATPEMIAAAWATWHKRHGGKLGPGPAFVEAINAALAVARAALERSEAEAVTKSMHAEAQRLLANKPKAYGDNP